MLATRLTQYRTSRSANVTVQATSVPRTAELTDAAMLLCGMRRMLAGMRCQYQMSRSACVG
eukprot:317309-Rhodomonas_salina.3